MKKTRSLFLISLILMGSAVSCRAQADGNTPPDFTATDIRGNEVTLSSLKGKVVLLDFWATWCPPCRVEVPYLIDIHKSFRDSDFVLISVSLDRNLEAARRFVREKGMGWVHIIDLEAGFKLAEKYQVEAIPSTFLIDRKGRIAAMQLRGNALKDRIADLLR